MIRVIAGFIFFLSAVSASANQCAQINCKCNSLPEGRWRNACETQQNEVNVSCESNSGVIKTYCGLHGPKAFPVAVSLNSSVPISDLKDFDEQSMVKQIETQRWSLAESYDSVKQKESAQQYGDAVQMLALHERDVDRLYDLQKIHIHHLLAQGHLKQAKVEAQTYVSQMLQYASNIKSYSESLWSERTAMVKVDRVAAKAYRVMGLKLARMAASIYEQAGDLLGDAQLYTAAAKAWQNAAVVAQDLIAMETVSENKSRHIEFYQAQAGARFNRATYYWLQTQSHLDDAEKTAHLAELALKPKLDTRGELSSIEPAQD